MHGVEDLAPLAAWSLAYATRSLSVTRPRLQSPRGSAPVWVVDPLPPGRRNPQWTRVSGAYALVQVLSVRKSVTQLVRRLPKKSADALPEEQAHIASRSQANRL